MRIKQSVVLIVVFLLAGQLIESHRRAIGRTDFAHFWPRTPLSRCPRWASRITGTSVPSGRIQHRLRRPEDSHDRENSRGHRCI
jgi:hypothetical protein